MKTILVPLEEGGSLPSILQCTLLTARRFGSYIEGLYDQADDVSQIIASGEGLGITPPDIVEAFQQREQEHAVHAHELFEAFMKENGVPLSGGRELQEGVSASWIEESIPGRELIGHRGRIFDLTVVGRPVRNQATPSMGLLEAALFETGRPVLVAPPTVPTSAGENVVIAWNGSDETARAVTFAMPFILKASKVTVAEIEDGMVAGPNAADVTIHLQRNGVNADIVHIPVASGSAGHRLLAEADRLGVDLLVKGAYTRSRLRQMIFGGITSHILDAADIPVLMSY